MTTKHYKRAPTFATIIHFLSTQHQLESNYLNFPGLHLNMTLSRKKKVSRKPATDKTRQKGRQIGMTANEAQSEAIQGSNLPPSPDIYDRDNLFCGTEADVSYPNTFRRCEKCTEHERENGRLSKLFNDAKEKLAREETLVNELTRNSTQSARSIAKLETKLSAVMAKLEAYDRVKRSRPDGENNITGAVSRYRSVRKKNNLSRMSVKELTTGVDPKTDDKYVPFILAVRQLASSIVFDELTESSIEDDLIGNITRSRDWHGRYEEVSECILNSSDKPILGNPPLRLGNDGEIFAAPLCPLALAAEGSLFTPRGKYPHAMIEAAAADVVKSEGQFAHLKEPGEWQRALGALNADVYTRTLFLKTMDSRLSNHKRTCKNKYFNSLGYDTFGVTTKSIIESNRRLLERENIKKTLVQTSINTAAPIAEESDIVTVDNVDCTTWRLSEWEDIYNPSKPLIKEIEFSIDIGEGEDAFFSNNAARNAYVELTGFMPIDDGSVMSLGRADAWFTTVSLLVMLPDGKGGNRNGKFTETFSSLLPRCVDGILKTIRERVSSLHPEEFLLRDVEDFEPSLAIPTDVHYALRLGERLVTDIVYVPSKEAHYLYITKDAFHDHICSWLTFTDAFIGCAGANDMSFNEIRYKEDVPDYANVRIENQNQSEPTETRTSGQTSSHPLPEEPHVLRDNDSIGMSPRDCDDESQSDGFSPSHKRARLTLDAS